MSWQCTRCGCVCYVNAEGHAQVCGRTDLGWPRTATVTIAAVEPNAGQITLHRDDEIAALRARVAELEAKVQDALAITDAANLHVREDLYRKRDECARLEHLLSEVREQRLRACQERDLLRTELGSAMADNARLRRELRGKR